MNMEKENSHNYNIKKDLILTAGLLASRFSLSPIVGQIYALLYFSPNPISLDDMVMELKISKGSASTNIRALESWGAVKKVLIKGSRKDNYTANPNIEAIITARLKSGIKRRFNEVNDQIETSKKCLIDVKHTDFFHERIAKVHETYKKFLNFMELIPDE